MNGEAALRQRSPDRQDADVNPLENARDLAHSSGVTGAQPATGASGMAMDGRVGSAGDEEAQGRRATTHFEALRNRAEVRPGA